VRNKIYQHYFADDAIIELLSKSSHYDIPKVKGSTHHNTTRVIRCGEPLGSYSRVLGLNTKWDTSASALHLVNHRVYFESLTVLYGSVVFFFQAPTQILTFSKIVGRSKLPWIKRLHFDQHTYSHPRALEDEKWREKNKASWSRTCAFLSRGMPSLEELHINMILTDSPLRFSFGESWAVPLFEFGMLSHLKDFQIKLDSRFLQGCKIDPTDLMQCIYMSPQQVRNAVECYQTAQLMHQFFAGALAKKIQGASGFCAVQGYREMCKERFGGMSSELRQLYIGLSNHFFGSAFDSPRNWAWVNGLSINA
jgi:hypothetical protein